MPNQIIRILLKAYLPSLVDRGAFQITKQARGTGANIVGPVPLPTKKNRYTVNRAPHVEKKIREQFEIRTHKRLIEIDANESTINALKGLELEAGVDVEVKIKKTKSESGIKIKA